jgi:transposase
MSGLGTWSGSLTVTIGSGSVSLKEHVGPGRGASCALEGLVERAECSDKPVVWPFHRSDRLIGRAVEREQAGLPRYSPQLNPMENVWRRIKGFLLPRRFSPTVAELRAAVIQAVQLLEGTKPKIQCPGT